jgi:RimJ/RimL family protein N-acetyltransferase
MTAIADNRAHHWMFETERLKIRQYTHDDLEELIEMRTDPDVYRYLGGELRQNAAEITKRLGFYMDCYEKFGFGMSAMIWKETGETIGGSGLQPLEDTGEIEVGYNLKKRFWRMGIGYECAHAWLTYGFNTAGLERIVAVADADNTGSWRIMEKCGMKFEKMQNAYNMECKFYAVSKHEFLNQSAA